MTREQLVAIFPRASDDFLDRNATSIGGDAGGNPAINPRPVAVVERNSGHGALRPRPPQKRDTRRFLVRVTSFRIRLLDEDNLCEKYHVDCCRYAGILPTDAGGKTKIETSQEKVGSEAEERVEIVIKQTA